MISKKLLLRFSISTLFLLGFFTSFETGLDRFVWRRIFDAGHFAAFFLLTFYLCYEFRLSGFSKARSVAFSTLLAIGLAVGIEVVQPLVGRSASRVDILNGLLGILTAALTSARVLRLGLSVGRLFRASMLASSLQLLVLVPTFRAYQAVIWREKAFPVLGDFSEREEKYLWEATASNKKRSAKVKHFRYLPQDDATVLEVMTIPGRWSGLRYIAGGTDWSDYQELHLRLYIPPAQDLELAVRIDDENYREKYEDRFTKHLQLSSGWQEVVIPLKEVEQAPEKRKLNLKRVAYMHLYVNKDSPQRTFFIDKVWLEGRKTLETDKGTVGKRSFLTGPART